MSELLDNLNEIELQKASFIIPKNLKKNVKALGVTGTLEYLDTTDATAQAKDIKEGQTAYVNDVKITGNLQYEPSDFSLNGITGDPVSTELKTSGNNKYIQLKYKRSGADTIVGGSANVTANLQQETMAVAANITADKIKKGVEVLGVTGTYEGSGGSGDIKLFDTIEQMQQDTTAQEGDLAVVYREELTGITEESEFDSCTFPDKVVLDEAFTNDIYGSFMAVDSSSGYFEGMIEMSPSGFRFDGYGESDEIRVQYESQDGITYTRTDGGEELQEFGVIIKWEDYGEGFNSVIGDFMKISGSCFEGLYEYKSYIDKNYIHIPLLSGLSDITPSSCIFDGISYSPEFEVNKITNIAKKLYRDEDVSGYNMTYKDGHLVFMTELQSGVTYWTNEDKFEVYNATVIGGDYYEYILDLDNETYTKRLAGYANAYGSDLPHGRINYIPDGFVAMYVDYGDGYIINNGINSLQYYDGTNSTESTIENNPKNWFVPRTNYVLVTAQLDAIADYVYSKTFYGKKGVEVGSLGVPDDSLIDVNAIVYRDIAKTYDSMPVMIINDSNKSTFNLNKIYVTPIKFDGTPLLDTGNVTNFRNMFLNNTNLVAVTNLNTINANNMEHMFRGCNNLSYVCNISTSNVKSFTGMFYDCANLIDMPKFNTSNATHITWMFYRCTSLENLPYYDFSKAGSSTQAFAKCTNLKNISVYNFSNILTSDGWGMFQDCPNLTNAGLNNALASLATIVHFQDNLSTHKTLKWAGLSEIQANVCTNLSNWAPLASNGWTTGY